MSVGVHLVLMAVSTLIVWFGFAVVITSVDPFTAPWWGFFLFYATLFLSVFGTLALISYTIRSAFPNARSTIRARLRISFRQAFLWSIALVLVTALQAERLLHWWVLGLVLLLFVLIETIALSVDQARQS